MYLVEPIILEEIASGYADFGNDVIPSLIESNRNVYGYKMNNDVLPIDTPDLLAKHVID